MIKKEKFKKFGEVSNPQLMEIIGNRIVDEIISTISNEITKVSDDVCEKIFEMEVN